MGYVVLGTVVWAGCVIIAGLINFNRRHYTVDEGTYVRDVDVPARLRDVVEVLSGPLALGYHAARWLISVGRWAADVLRRGW